MEIPYKYIFPMQPEMKHNFPGISPKYIMNLVSKNDWLTTKKENSQKNIAKMFLGLATLSITLFIMVQCLLLSNPYINISRLVWRRLSFVLATSIVISSYRNLLNIYGFPLSNHSLNRLLSPVFFINEKESRFESYKFIS